MTKLRYGKTFKNTYSLDLAILITVFVWPVVPSSYVSFLTFHSVLCYASHVSFLAGGLCCDRFCLNKGILSRGILTFREITRAVCQLREGILKARILKTRVEGATLSFSQAFLNSLFFYVCFKSNGDISPFIQRPFINNHLFFFQL